MTEFIINDIRENGIESFIIREMRSIISSWDASWQRCACDFGEEYDRITDKDLDAMEEILRNNPDITANAECLSEVAYAVYQAWLG